MADDYAASTSRSYYSPSSSNQLARVWSVDKWVQDAVAAGFLNVFEGAGSDPTALSGYSTNKLWMRVPATGVTTASAEVRKWNGSSPASSLANWPVASDLITSLIFGGTAGWTQTTNEAAAGITPTNTSYLPGDVRRYGADPTGVTAADTAWINACKSGHLVLGGGRSCVYKITSQITITTAFHVDGQGCTIKPYTAGIGFVRSMPSAAATPTISSGATQGSRAVVVSSTTGLAVGQWVRFKDNNEVHPPGWARITAIDTGTNTVTIDRALQHAYTALSGGSLSLEAFTAASFLEHALIRNVKFDGSESTSASVGEAVDIAGFLLAEIVDCQFSAWSDSTSSNAIPVALVNCITTVLDGNASADQDNGPSGAPPWLLVWHSRFCSIRNNTFEGHGFGPEAVRCDHVVFQGNMLSGRRQQESDDAESAQSTRAMKAAYCGRAVWSMNQVTGFESAIKSDDNFVTVAYANVVAGAVGMSDTGQILINCAFTQQSTITGNGAHTGATRALGEIAIGGNIVDGVPSTAIGITSAATSGTVDIRVAVTGNKVRNCGRHAVYVSNDANSARAIQPSIVGNDVSNWGLAGTHAAIQHSDHGGVILGNEFRHSTNTALECISGFGTGYLWQVAKNVSHNGNPVKQEEGTHTLASASTVYIGIHPQRNVVITGTTTITSFGGGNIGDLRLLRFTGVLTITHHATNLISPTGADITTAANDLVMVQREGSGWRVLARIPA